MKILHAFDTHQQRDILRKLRTSYADMQICLVKKSITHRVLYYILPFITWYLIIWAAVGIVLKYMWLTKQSVIMLMWLLLIFIASLIVQRYRLFVSHYGDYIIVTPDMISIYNQWGLLNRTCKTIYVHNIAGIFVNKEGIINSIRNEWFITIEEFGFESKQSVAFGPISNPDHVKEVIEGIISTEGLMKNNDYHPKIH
jgi:hypothetical protein